MTAPAAAAFDVAVLGLGPVGMTLAHLLCHHGLRVVGLDKRTGPHPHPRAIGLDHESMRVFQEIGIAEDLLPFTEIYRPSEYRNAAGALLRRIVAAPEPFPLAWPPNLTFVQPELERLLLEYAGQRPSLSIRLGTEAVVADTDGAGTSVLVRESPDREANLIRCRFVVACDGASSPTRQLLGIAMEDLDFDEPWLVVDVLLDADVTLPEVNIQLCDPHRPMTYVRGPGRLRRWEIMILPGEAPEEVLAEPRIWAFLGPWLRPGEATIWRAATYRFHALIAKQWRQGPIFLAGDACHQTPPFLAQGLNQGIRDAANLAWKLAAVTHGKADEALLDTYQAERQPNVTRVIAATKDLGRLICERDPDRAAQRDERMLAERAARDRPLVRQDFLPHVATGLVDPGCADGTGMICPQPWVAAGGGWTRLDDVAGRGWHVILDGDLPVTTDIIRGSAALGASLIGLVEGSARDFIGEGEVNAIVEKDGVLAAWMKKHGCKALIVRPDNIVYATATTSDNLERSIRNLLAILESSTWSQKLQT